MTTITQVITALPTPPATTDPANFDTRADAFLVSMATHATELETFRGQANTVAGEVNTNAANAATSATNASNSATTASGFATTAGTHATNAGTSAGTATTQAGIATTQATAASNYAAALAGASASSVLIATGAKSFTASTGKQWTAGQFLQIASAANNANFMHGTVTSYDSGTGALVMNVTDIGGSGTLSDWLINVSGTQGPTGATGAGTPALLVTLSGTAASTVDFATLITSSYRTYMFRLVQWAPSAASLLQLQTSSNAGVSYDSAAASYAYTGNETAPTPAAVAFGSTSATSMGLTGTNTSNTVAHGGIHGTVELHNPSNTTAYKHVRSELVSAINATDFYTVSSAGARLSTSAVNAVRFKPSSGTVDYIIEMWGVA